MMKLVSSLSLVVLTLPCYAQVGGGSAAYGNQRGQTGVEAARTAELAKRNAAFGDGKFVDAAVLMNVPADEYVATFGINEEGKTLEEAQRKMDSSIRTLSANLQALKIPASDFHVDFVAQNRIYGYDTSEQNLIKEVVVGFEVKKNIAIRYKNKSMLDAITVAASKSQVFDLVKVDYVVLNMAPVRKQLLAEAAKVINEKVQEQETLLGMKVGQLTLAVPADVSTYFPVEMYESYVAQESEEMYGFRQNVNIQRARKPRTFYYNPLGAKDFDAVINPTVIEPCVQFTVYVRMKY